MPAEVDLGTLRGLVDTVANSIAQAGRHVDLPDRFARVSLPVPEGGSKKELAKRSVASLDDDQLPEIARLMLAEGSVDAETRNAIQDVLWAADATSPINKRIRREIARELDLSEFLPAYDRFKNLLRSLWILGSETDFFLLADDGWNLSAQIDRHVQRNPGDWTGGDLFDHLGAFDASDKRFALFLEGLVSGETLPDEAAQRRVVAALNSQLDTTGLVLSETGEVDGYPEFSLVQTRAHGFQPKTLIFATLSKPDLRLRVIDNEIEIASGADDVLVYNRKIPRDGLRWRDLQTWWKESQAIESDDEAKRTLWRRLRRSLPDSSPQQQRLFELYHDIHGEQIYDLPALLPEVWLHWDHRTAKARGLNAMLNLRMDFLMLLPGGHRIVLEVDGKHHYATGSRADPTVYAKTMRGDRNLKLARYDVFRFGTADLEESTARETVLNFFHNLFRTYRMISDT